MANGSKRANRTQRLFFENFRAFPLGAIPNDYYPLREYHFFVPEAGRWYEGTLHSAWRSTSKGNPKERWTIIDEDGEAAIEQPTLYEGVPPLFITGEAEWSLYTLRVRVRPLREDGRAGLVFLYQNNMDYYAFTTDGRTARLERVENPGRRDPELTLLAKAPWLRDCDQRITMEVAIYEGRVEATVTAADGASVTLEAAIDAGRKGKIGLVSENPARFYNVEVLASPEEKRVWFQTRDRLARELDEARAQYPTPRLEKVIDTRGFGAGKALRFGDLDGDGRLDILIAQNQPRIGGDTYSMISCLTAITQDGQILWQRGRPSPKHALLTNDVAMQIYDIDGDGKNEVICTQDFRMLILDGRTGEIKRQARTPRPVPLPGDSKRSEDALYRIVGDCIHICNVRGLDRPRDLLLKDRYNNVWVYDDQFNLLWSAQAHSTGHFPYSHDIDGDGRDEILVGYTLFSADGKKLWNLDFLVQHADGLGVLPTEDRGEVFVIAGGDDGILFVDFDGKVISHDLAGHLQTANFGNFRPDLPGLEYVSITYHRYPGVFSIFGSDRRLLHRSEPFPVGSHIKPVNWTGKGDELIFFSASTTWPGLLDGYGRSVINLPDDGHPELCSEPVDLFGDPRDELVVWDADRIWIYTQGEPFEGEKIYTPKRPPHYNYSNYRCEISLPGWTDWK